LKKGLDSPIDKLPVGQINGWGRFICIPRK